jgi:D-alanyl-lipoteichoic acid acyltransferase DltB (MBOAT superfamily)
MGLFKKVVIADTFAKWATAGFDHTQTLNLIEAWATSLSYTFQLYFDFSGYTDMAIGAALLFNIKLPINFNSPYQALNIQDFWRRWHITLSRFLRDYVYIPLGGNKKGMSRTYTNLLITFLLGGIWHGAGWTFIFWGALHGIALIIHKFYQTFNIHLPKVVAWFITFNFINISWVFFRAIEYKDAIHILNSMMGFNGVVIKIKWAEKLHFLKDYGVEFNQVTQHIGGGSKILNYLILAFIISLIFKNSHYYYCHFKASWLNLLIGTTFFLVAISQFSDVSEFLYFNF